MPPIFIPDRLDRSQSLLKNALALLKNALAVPPATTDSGLVDKRWCGTNATAWHRRTSERVSSAWISDN